MNKILLISLAALLLCAFGAGPFWGLNKSGGSGGGGGFVLSNIESDTSDVNESSASPITFSYDSGGADGIIVAVCGLNLDGNPVLSGTTAMTYNGVAMTQRHQSGNIATDYPMQAVYYLNNPAAGTNTISITWDSGATSASRVIVAAQISGQSVTQSGDTHAGWSSDATHQRTVSGHAVGDLFHHFACGRGGPGAPLQSDNLTIVGSGSTGSSPTADMRWLLASDAATGTADQSNLITSDQNRTATGLMVITQQ